MFADIDDKVGFFRREHIRLSKSLKDVEMSSFSSLKTDAERFAFVHSLSDKLDQFSIIEADDCGKNMETAEHLKLDGNLAFKTGDMSTALNFYNRSLLKHPDDRETRSQLAIVYANRSAALYHLGEHELSINDIDLAIENDYPKAMSHKILERKARCLLAMKQHKSALDAFRKTFVALDDAKGPVEERRKAQTNIQIMIAMMTKDKNISDECRKKKSETYEMDYGVNPAFPSVSAAVHFRKNDQLGRYAEAKRRIAVGSTILIEKPYSAVLLEENAGTHCFHCFKRFLAAIPCKYCCVIAFCSKTCRTQALDSYHQYECKVLKQLWASKASITCLIAIRLIMQHPLEYFIKIKPLLEQARDFGESDKNSEANYLSVYDLVRHDSSRTAEDFLHRAHMAVFLFKCLRAAKYFPQLVIPYGEKGALTDDETFIGGLILRHLQLLQFNVHEVSELIIPQKATLNDGRGKYLGAAIFPTLALFNHSCDPSVVRYFDGNRVIVNAIKDMKKDEMVAENYGPIFTRAEREERQKTLKDQYWFTCECIACTENWPTFEEMNDEASMRFRCESKNCSNIIVVPSQTLEFLITCQVCKKVTNIIKGLKVLQDTDSKFTEGQQFFDRGNVKKALATFLELLQLLHDILAPPFKGYILCQQAIKTCFLHLGNKFVEPKIK